MLPAFVQQFVERGRKGEWVFAYQLVCSDAPSFRVFGIRVEGDARHIEESGFFGYVAESVTMPLA